MASTIPFSIAGMKLAEIAPPTTTFLNTKPSPRAAGARRSATSPNSPAPPDCFLWR